MIYGVLAEHIKQSVKRITEQVELISNKSPDHPARVAWNKVEGAITLFAATKIDKDYFALLAAANDACGKITYAPITTPFKEIIKVWNFRYAICLEMSKANQPDEKQVMELKAQLQTKQKECEQLTTSVNDLKTRLASTEQSFATAFSQLSEEKAKNAASLQKLKEENTHLASKVEELAGKIKMSEQQLLEAEKTSLLTEIGNLRKLRSQEQASMHKPPIRFEQKFDTGSVSSRMTTKSTQSSTPVIPHASEEEMKKIRGLKVCMSPLRFAVCREVFTKIVDPKTLEGDVAKFKTILASLLYFSFCELPLEKNPEVQAQQDGRSYLNHPQWTRYTTKENLHYLAAKTPELEKVINSLSMPKLEDGNLPPPGRIFRRTYLMGGLQRKLRLELAGQEMEKLILENSPNNHGVAEAPKTDPRVEYLKQSQQVQRQVLRV